MLVIVERLAPGITEPLLLISVKTTNLVRFLNSEELKQLVVIFIKLTLCYKMELPACNK